MKSIKKKVLGIFIGNFETYTRYSQVADEKRSQGAIWKKSLGNPSLNKLIKQQIITNKKNNN